MKKNNFQRGIKTLRSDRKHPDLPPTELEINIGKALGKSPWMIRYYAYRMALEISLRRTLDAIEQRKVAACVLKEMRLNRKH